MPTVLEKKQARMRIVVSSSGVIAALVVFLGTTADGETTFFSVPNATGTFAQGINNVGQVVGTYVLNGQVHAFLRDSDGSLMSFDFPDAVSTAANGINDNGQICGTYTTGNGSGRVHGFIRNADRSYVTFDVPDALTTYAWGINNAGTVIGSYFFDSGQYRAFSRTADGAFETFDAPNAPAGATFALGINNLGEIVGGSGTFSYLRSADGQTFGEFNSQNAGAAGAFGVNDADYSVGSFAVPTLGDQPFARTPDGAFIEFSICGGCNTTVGGINNSGVIVGNTFNIYSGEPSVAYIVTIQDLVLPESAHLLRRGSFTVSKVTSALPANGSVAGTVPHPAPNISPSATVSVTAAGGTKPFGAFDTPVDGTTNVSGAIPLSGWALDSVEVVKVDIWREPITGEAAGSNGLVYIGDAAFVVGARPDVQSAHPNLPFNYRGGWCYQMLTNFLPNTAGSGPSGNGTYKLHALAHNKAGATSDLGTKTITVDNAHAAKPFGALDTPDQSGTPSGSAYLTFGWALAQKPNMIPIDGSTITVVVDGQAIGHPAYNNPRSDIATLFPGYRNSGGAVGFFSLDTTKLANGVHTISWNVVDNAGHGDRIGSRYFNVLNSAGSVAAREQEAMEPAASARARLVEIEIEEVGYIEIPMGATAGYQLAGGKRVPLPIGSSLRRGVFYWQPGPGFLGEYDLIFQQRDGNQVSVHVKIRPRMYMRSGAK